MYQASVVCYPTIIHPFLLNAIQLSFGEPPSTILRCVVELNWLRLQKWPEEWAPNPIRAKETCRDYAMALGKGEDQLTHLLHFKMRLRITPYCPERSQPGDETDTQRKAEMKATRN